MILRLCSGSGRLLVSLTAVRATDGGRSLPTEMSNILYPPLLCSSNHLRHGPLFDQSIFRMHLHACKVTGLTTAQQVCEIGEEGWFELVLVSFSLYHTVYASHGHFSPVFIMVSLYCWTRTLGVHYFVVVHAFVQMEFLIYISYKAVIGTQKSAENYCGSVIDIST